MASPAARGPLSERVLGALTRPVHRVRPLPGDAHVDDEDLQLTLYCCYELHYRGLAGVEAEWEWEPSLLELRRSLERRFEAALRDRIALPAAVAPEDIDVAL